MQLQNGVQVPHVNSEKGHQIGSDGEGTRHKRNKITHERATEASTRANHLLPMICLNNEPNPSTTRTYPRALHKPNALTTPPAPTTPKKTLPVGTCLLIDVKIENSYGVANYAVGIY